MKQKVVIYVACSLTHAPEDYKESIKAIKEKLREVLPNVEILEFLGLTAGTAEDVYRHDIHNNVAKCDLMIADCTYPSTGLGWEMATAVEKLGIQVLAIAKSGTKVTRLVIGAKCELNPYYDFWYYEALEDIIPFVSDMVEEIASFKLEM